MEATVKEVDVAEATAGKLGDIKWAVVAEKHCKDLYDTLYRLLSSDGTHTTINAIHRGVVYDAARQMTGFKVGPDTDGMVETLKAACLMFLWAADPFARAFEKNDNRSRIQEQLHRFEQLPRDEPTNAHVVANFRP